MLQFFRKIRYNHLGSGKTTNYLKYALGEIILVVIGILIALQVNNWNETRKIRQEQLSFLNTLKEDLNNDLAQLDRILAFQKEKLKTINELKEHILTGKDYDKIEQLFARTQTTPNDTYFPNTGSYTTAVSSGKLASLNPSNLKIAITNLYERYYYRLIYNGEVYDKRNDEVAFKRGKFFNKLTMKLNGTEVIGDSEFANLITIVIYDNTNYVNLGSQTRNEILSVLDLIDQTLIND